MGYTFTSGATKKDTIAEITRDFHLQDKHYACIKRALRGQTLWSVWTKTEGASVERYIRCDLLRKDGDSWGHKAMSEREHPYQYSCPLGYLDLAPATCEEWRDKVRKFHHKPEVGERIMLQGSTIPYITVTSVKPLQGVYEGKLYRIPRGMIA